MQYMLNDARCNPRVYSIYVLSLCVLEIGGVSEYNTGSSSATETMAVFSAASWNHLLAQAILRSHSLPIVLKLQPYGHICIL